MRAAVAALLLVACKPSWDEVRAASEDELAKVRAGLDARLVLMERLGVWASEEADPAPAVELGSRPKLRFDDYGPSANVLVVSIVDLERTNLHADVQPLEFRSLRLQKAREMVAGFVADSNDAESLEKARAGVVRRVEMVTGPRAREVVLPHVESINPQAFARDSQEEHAGTFTPGSFAGDLLLYDLQDGSFLGGAPILAKTPDTIEVRGNLSFLSDGLYTPVREAMTAELAKIADDDPRF